MDEKPQKGFATAKVNLVVTVALSQGWGDDCTVGQVLAQGRREAAEKITRMINTDPQVAFVRVKGVEIRIVEER